MRWVAAACCLGLLAAATSAAAQQAGADQLTQLRQDLHLTPAQDAAWSAYTAALQPSAEMVDRHRAAQELMPTLTTPRRIALIQANRARDEADLRRQGLAVMAFYSQLTPEQQRTFDADTLPRQSGQESR
jgi:hypothetical protein